MSVPLPPSARLPPVSLSLFVSPNPSFTDSAERTQPANQTPQAVGFLCGRVGYLDVGRFSITCLFHRRSASWLGTTGHRSDHLPTQTLFYHVPMNAQGLNLSGVAPHRPPPPQLPPNKKNNKKLGTCRVCATKGLIRLLCSVLFFHFKCLLGFCALFRPAYSNKSEIMEQEIFTV